MIAAELFAGCGGMALGLHRAGFECSVAVERDKHAAASFRANLPTVSVMEMGVDDWTGTPGDVDLLAGGPPCQGYSQAGLRRGAEDERDGFPAFFRVVERLRPRALLIENVPGLLTTRFEAVRADILARIAALGYHMPQGPLEGGIGRILNAADFGVPQRRKRILIVAFRDEADARRFRWPTPTHSLVALARAKWATGDYWRGISREPLFLRRGVEHDSSGPQFQREPRPIDLPAHSLLSSAQHQPTLMAPLGLVSHLHGAHVRDGERDPSSVDAPAPTLRADGAESHQHSIVAVPGIEPTREELRALRLLPDGFLPWRTVRQAIGDLLLDVTEAVRTEAPLDHDPRPLTIGEASYLASHPEQAAKHPPVGMDSASKTLTGAVSKGVPHGLLALDHDPRPLTPGEVAYLERHVRQGHGGKHPAAEMDREAPTIPANIARGVPYGLVDLPGRPPQARALRRLTVRECARLQDFPDEWRFAGPKSAQFKQIGNAVPPRLVEVVARAIREALEPGRG